MSFCRQPLPIPDETREIAEKVCTGSTAWYISFSRELRRLYSSLDIESLYEERGQWGVHPFRSFAFMMLQVMEGLSDRDAAAQITVNIGWKYVLALPLDHPGWDPTVLCTERDRLLRADAMLVLDKQLEMFKEKGLLDTTKQRLDSTPIEACVKSLNRTELIFEAVRAAIESLAQTNPRWMDSIAKADWRKRYYFDRPFNYRLPKKESERNKLAQASGEDGFYILSCIEAQAPVVQTKLKELPAIKVLVRILEEQFHPPNDKAKPKLREPKELKPSGERIASPHEIDARSASKNGKAWIGYKLHTTETCVEGSPNFIIDARVEPATTNDSLTLPNVVERLRSKDLLPKKLFVDSGYVNAPFFTKAHHELGFQIVAPLLNGHSWQSKMGRGFDSGQFHVDFERKQAVCPIGTVSNRWKQMADGLINVYFPKPICSACPSKEYCTRADRRIIKLQPQLVYEYQQLMRVQQETQEFKQEYATRAGAEGTQAQVVRTAGRRSALRGQAKTDLRYVLACVAINFARFFRWNSGLRPRVTPTGKFLSLAVA